MRRGSGLKRLIRWDVTERASIYPLGTAIVIAAVVVGGAGWNVVIIAFIGLTILRRLIAHRKS